MLKLLCLLLFPANREGPQLPEQSKASKRLAQQPREGLHVHSPGKYRPMPNQVPGNLAPLQVPKERAGQRLTRVGENSACKLDVILQKKFPSTPFSAVGNLIVWDNP